MEMNIPFEHTLENMCTDLENSPLSNNETTVMEEIEHLTADSKTKLLSMVSKEDAIEAEDAIDDVEYFSKRKAYAAGFRRAMSIMLDSLYGGGNNE